MNSAPSISIVIPAYNVGRFIEHTLQSVLDQTVSNWECIVIDDGSTDDTATVVQRFVERDGRIRLIRQPNGGQSKARNAGMAAVHPDTELVCFLDSDDIWVPHALEWMRSAMDANPASIGAHGLADLIDEHGIRLDEPGGRMPDFAEFGRNRIVCENGQMIPLSVSDPTTFRSLYPVSRLYPSGLVLIRRSALDKVGPFDGTYAALEDWDLWLRLARVGAFQFVNDVVIHYRRHANNLTNNVRGTTRDVRRLLSKHYFSKENTVEHRRIVAEGFRAYHTARKSENASLVREHLNARRYRNAVIAALKTCHHSLVCLRGFPTPIGL